MLTRDETESNVKEIGKVLPKDSVDMLLIVDDLPAVWGVYQGLVANVVPYHAFEWAQSFEKEAIENSNGHVLGIEDKVLSLKEGCGEDYERVDSKTGLEENNKGELRVRNDEEKVGTDAGEKTILKDQKRKQSNETAEKITYKDSNLESNFKNTANDSPTVSPTDQTCLLVNSSNASSRPNHSFHNSFQFATSLPKLKLINQNDCYLLYLGPFLNQIHSIYFELNNYCTKRVYSSDSKSLASKFVWRISIRFFWPSSFGLRY